MQAVGMFDGKIVPIDQPVAKLEDRGYQFGDGVYDAWCMLNGRHFLLDDHLERLRRSCGLIGITPSFSKEEMTEIIGNMAKGSEHEPQGIITVLLKVGAATRQNLV